MVKESKKVFVKDVAGKWYEIEQGVLEDKEIDRNKALEAMVSERALKRQRMVEILEKIDDEERQMLMDLLLGSWQSRQPTYPLPGTTFPPRALGPGGWPCEPPMAPDWNRRGGGWPCEPPMAPDWNRRGGGWPCEPPMAPDWNRRGGGWPCEPPMAPDLWERFPYDYRYYAYPMQRR